MKIPRSILITAAFLLAPLSVGIVTAFSQLSATLIPKLNKDLQAAALANLPPPPELKLGKLRAAILLSETGTQLTDVLGPAQVLGETGRIDLYTVASERRALPTTGAVAILPHYAFAEAPRSDIIVVPAVLDPQSPKLIEWLQTNRARAKWVLVVCEGARLAKSAGLLDGKSATSHALALPDLMEAPGSTRWLPGPRYVIDGNVITTAGVTGAVDGALFLVEKLFGAEEAVRLSDRLGWARTREEDPTGQRASLAEAPSILRASDILQLYLRAGFEWFRGAVGVLLYPGVSELGLAAPLELLARPQDWYLTTVAASRTPVRTQHGIDLLAIDTVGTVLPLEFFITPSRGVNPDGSPTRADPTQDTVIQRWITEQPTPARSFLHDPAGASYAQILALLQDRQGPAITDLVARLVEWRGPRPPSDAGTSAWPLRLWIRPFILGALFALLAAWIVRRLSR